MVGMFKHGLLVLLMLTASSLFAPPKSGEVDYKGYTWAEQTFDSLTVDERIAQLFMIEARPTYGAAHLNKVRETIKKHKVGGVIFFKGNPVQQVKLTNEFQEMSETKMLVAIDGEWGLAMRLANTISYPYQLGLGSIQNDSLIYEMGREIGRQCKRLGIHVNFAPVIDVNNNPNNPVINYRSFGEDPTNVCNKGWAYASGMQDEGVIACAKHFPGHGDTDVDSHKDLPVINHSMQRLQDVEFQPFQFLVNQGVRSVMTAHLYIPAIDDRKNIAASISDKAVNGILRKQMGFIGLSFTDALNMQGVAKYHPDGELELKALLAGNDILLSPGDIPKATALIKNAMKSGKVSEEYVWGKVMKVLNYKHAMGLHKFEPLKEDNVVADLNNTRAKHINYELVEKELCLVKDEHRALPLDTSSNKNNIVTISIGNGSKTTLQTELNKYGIAKHLSISKNANYAEFSAALKMVEKADLSIISLHNTSKYPPSFGITSNTQTFVNQANKVGKVLLVDFGNPYNLKKFPGQKSILVAYEDKEENQIKAAQAIAGVVGVNGVLPVTVSEEYKANMGTATTSVGELHEAIPEEVGMDADHFRKVDEIVRTAIRTGATPGCQIFVAKNGRTVYNKSYGKFSYDPNATEVDNSHLYDLASITKVAATTLAVMKLEEQGKLTLNDKMSKYLPELRRTNKEFITIKMVLEHKAGLKSWIPFYFETVKEEAMYDSIYSKTPTNKHTIQVGKDLYMLEEYKDRIFERIYESEIKNVGKYKYSDLGMMLMKELVEQVTEMNFEDYMNITFYKPMGLNRVTFLPLKKFELEQIIPTAEAPDMRKNRVQGYVHDPGAAMLGGVSGHAGLFGNAESLGALMQMLLNGGTYNGTRYLQEETINKFTKKQASDSRRGLGWDKPEPNRKKPNPCSDYASSACFGHTGFTGTMVWTDPKHDLIFVFLSNRVYPSQNNRKLISQNVRTRILDELYKSFLNP
jgi:beta-N-acetylhexosaminidase